MWGNFWAARQTWRYPSSGEEAAVSLHGPWRGGSAHTRRGLGYRTSLCSHSSRNFIPIGHLLYFQHTCHHTWLQPICQSSSAPLQPGTGVSRPPSGPWNTHLHHRTYRWVDECVLLYLLVSVRLSLILLTDFQVLQAFSPHPLARTLHPKPPYPGCRWVIPFSWLSHFRIILLILPKLFLLTFLTNHMAYIFKLPFF